MESYINSIAREYDIPYDKAKEIVSKVKNDTVSDIKTNLTKNNPVQKIINDLSNEEYLNNIINNYVGELNNKLQSFLANDSIIKEYASNIKLTKRTTDYYKENNDEEIIIESDDIADVINALK